MTLVPVYIQVVEQYPLHEAPAGSTWLLYSLDIMYNLSLDLKLCCQQEDDISELFIHLKLEHGSEIPSEHTVDEDPSDNITGVKNMKSAAHECLLTSLHCECYRL